MEISIETLENWHARLKRLPVVPLRAQHIELEKVTANMAWRLAQDAPEPVDEVDNHLRSLAVDRLDDSLRALQERVEALEQAITADVTWQHKHSELQKQIGQMCRQIDGLTHDYVVHTHWTGPPEPFAEPEWRLPEARCGSCKWWINDCHCKRPLGSCIDQELRERRTSAYEPKEAE
jgi:hypothetical protein